MIDREERLLFGHLWAVGGASLLLLIFLFGEVFIIFIRALASLSPASFFGVLAFELLFFCFLWLFVGAYTWFTGTIPIAIVFLIAEKFSIRSVWYYLSSGILIGIAATPVFALLTWRFLSTLPFFERCMIDAPMVVACSAFGGLLYWWKAGRWSGATPASSNAAIRT